MSARRVALLLNGAGPQRQRRAHQALRELAEDGAELAAAVGCAVTTSLAEARREVYGAVAAGAEVLLFGGGDGTLAMGLSLLAEATRGRPLGSPGGHPAVGVLPLGTGNAFAHARGVLGGRERGGRRRVLLTQWQRARDPRWTPSPFATLECLGLRAPFAGFGVDAALISDHAATRDAWGGAVGRALGRAAALPGPLGAAAAPLGYALSVATRSLPRFALQARPRVTVRNLGAPAQLLDAGGAVIGEREAGAVLWEGDCTLAAASTIPCFGFGLRLFPHALHRRDRFSLRASDAGLVEILRNTRAAFAGAYASPKLHDFLVDRVALEVDRPAPFEVSGEAMGAQRRVEIALGPELFAI